MAATLFFIFVSILAMAVAVPETSLCYYGPVYGPLVNTLVKYQTIFVERVDLAQMKSVKIIGASTLSSCAATCTNLRLTSSDSCTAFYVDGGTCRAGILENAQNSSKPLGSSATLVATNILNFTSDGTLGFYVKPVTASASSIGSPSTRTLDMLWDRVTGKNNNVWTTSSTLFEYFQFDFGSCDLIFSQVVVECALSADGTIILASQDICGNIEVRIGGIELTGSGKASNPLCGKTGAVPLTPSWLVFKCQEPMRGRFVTVQHNNNRQLLSISEVTFYAI